MKKISGQIYIALFFLLCMIPSIGMFLGYKSEAAANEIQAKMPTSVTENGHIRKTVLKEVSAYLEDHYAMRQQLNTAWAKINAKLFRSSVDEQIIVGKDGWLYYSPTVPDYTGQSLTDADLRAIAENLYKLQSGIEAGGSRFVFTIAPNKNSLYGEQMPAAYRNGHDQSTAERLKPYLEEYGIHYVNLFDAFAAEPEILYYATDSHWTEKGAALASDRILAAAEKESCFYGSGFHREGAHLGDLHEMLYPAGKASEPSVVYEGEFSYTVHGSTNKGNAITIKTTNEQGEKRLLCWRDSFGITLYPYLSEAFQQSTFSRKSVYDLNEYPPSDYDVFVLEIVERNLKNLTGDCVIPQS